MKSRGEIAGKVFIVGAGPGAVDLITLRGWHALEQAEVVLYDALIDPRILDHAPSEAERVYVGKRSGHHGMEQEEINRLIVAQAREGKIVIRLKGGDPFVFGRGAEEAIACVEAGIAFEIIPGVSAAMGAASFAGIPLTHRGMSSSVAFVTAHGARCSESPDLDWINLAKSVDTLVIFMGSAWLEKIAAALIASGMPKTTPVAVISHATFETQATLTGALDTISGQVARAGLKTPMLIILGEVTRLSATLDWFRGDRSAACIPA